MRLSAARQLRPPNKKERALGYERANLLRGSYGTRVAMIYSWMYLDGLHRSVIIAANPPGHFVWEPEVIVAQIAYDAELCAEDPECSNRTDDLAETVRNVLRKNKNVK